MNRDQLDAPKRSKFRKIEFEVEAMGPVTVENAAEIALWCGGRVESDPVNPIKLYVTDAKGFSRGIAFEGYYVLLAEDGFYVVTGEHFRKTYEPILAVVPPEPANFHNLRVSVVNDYMTWKFTCTAPVGADCRMICPEGCEYWEYEHQHQLIDAGECNAKVSFDAYDWSECHESTGHESLLYNGPVNAFWDGEDFQWEIDEAGAVVPEPPAPADHVLKVEFGEFTNYHLTCNLNSTHPCRQVCRTHPEGGCGDPDSEGTCYTIAYANGCVIAEWVNDGGIEAVQFEHTLELPVSYYWDGAHDFPILVARAAAPEPPTPESES